MFNKIFTITSILLLIACGGGSTAETTVVNISSLGSEMKYDVEEFTVKAGSKVKVVINTDPEAPFFKHADYGIIGDAFDVIPKFINALK